MNFHSTRNLALTNRFSRALTYLSSRNAFRLRVSPRVYIHRLLGNAVNWKERVIQ